MDKPSVFIDTNVWFSAFYGSDSCSKIIKNHIDGKFYGIISQDVLNELVKNITNKVPQAIKPLKKLLGAKPPKIIKNPQKIDVQIKKNVDKKDCRIFQSAINSKSEYFITGNLKDFRIKKLEKIYKIKILSPKQFLKRESSNN